MSGFHGTKTDGDVCNTSIHFDLVKRLRRWTYILHINYIVLVRMKRKSYEMTIENVFCNSVKFDSIFEMTRKLNTYVIRVLGPMNSETVSA